MKKGWKEVKLGEVTEVIGGYAFKSKDFSQSESVPIVKIKNLSNSDIKITEDFVNDKFMKLDKKYHIKYNDILIALTGSHITLPSSAVGRIAKSRHRRTLLLNQRVGKFAVNKSVCNHDFLYYFLSSDYFFQSIGLRAKGAANQANISSTDIGNILIKLPPKVIQRKIADILSAYDDLIENNLKRIALLEEKARLTYEEWFVRLRFPGHEQVAINPKTGLPEEWNECKIKDICVVSGGGTPSKSNHEFWEGGDITWFSPTDLSKSDSLVVLDSSKKISSLGLAKSSAKLLQPNSFMMTSRATIGLFAVIDRPFSTNQGFINVTPLRLIDKGYLLYNFMHRIEEFKGHATGSTFLELTKSKFKTIDIIWPTSDVIERFDSVTRSIIETITTLKRQNQLLREARDLLLPRLMTGMIEV